MVHRETKVEHDTSRRSTAAPCLNPRRPPSRIRHPGVSPRAFLIAPSGVSGIGIPKGSRSTDPCAICMIFSVTATEAEGIGQSSRRETRSSGFMGLFESQRLQRRATAKSSNRSEIGDVHRFSPGSHASCIGGESKKGELPQFRATHILNLRLCRGPMLQQRRVDFLGRRSIQLRSSYPARKD